MTLLSTTIPCVPLLRAVALAAALLGLPGGPAAAFQPAAPEAGQPETGEAETGESEKGQAEIGQAESGGREVDPGAEARELARESIEKLLRAMELMLDSIPQYEAPEITEEGDIIIRRKREPDAPQDGDPSGESESVPPPEQT